MESQKVFVKRVTWNSSVGLHHESGAECCFSSRGSWKWIGSQNERDIGPCSSRSDWLLRRRSESTLLGRGRGAGEAWEGRLPQLSRAENTEARGQGEPMPRGDRRQCPSCCAEGTLSTGRDWPLRQTARLGREQLLQPAEFLSDRLGPAKEEGMSQTQPCLRDSGAGREGGS